jgi:hypothetical protein
VNWVEQFEKWVEQADDFNHGQWENEEAKFSKNLYVGNHTERDRRSIHGEAARGVKAAYRFWQGVPHAYRKDVAGAALLPITAIPEDLR